MKPGETTTERNLTINPKQEQNQEVVQTFVDKEVKMKGETYWLVARDILKSDKEYKGYQNRQEIFKKLVEAEGPSLISTNPAALIGVVNNQQEFKRWDSRTARNLTYSIDEASFSQYSADPKTVKDVINKTKKYMHTACTSWSSVCGVSFRQEDVKPLFRVVYHHDTLDPGLLASAFFPGDATRILHLYPLFPFHSTRPNPVGVLRHELGHILGFGHEHVHVMDAIIKKYGSKYNETLNFEALTPYDSKSVMHYYFEGIGGTTEGELTTWDETGARFYYGASEDIFTEYE